MGGVDGGVLIVPIDDQGGALHGGIRSEPRLLSSAGTGEVVRWPVG